MFQSQIRNLIEQCQEAESAGMNLNKILATIVPAVGQEMLRSSSEFLEWVQEEPELSYFYFDTLAQGVCAKPQEVAAMILELIVRDALE